MQQQIMNEQDAELDQLSHSVNNTRVRLPCPMRNCLQMYLHLPRQSFAWKLRMCVSIIQHIALSINEELDLQVRLLDDLDEDVDVTNSRLKAARKRIQQVLKKSNNCKCFLLMMFLIFVLMLVLAIGFKFLRV